MLREEGDKMKEEMEAWEREMVGLKKREAQLRREVDRGAERMKEARAEIEKVMGRNKAMEYTMKVTAEAQRKSESALKEKMEKTLDELEGAMKERNVLREQMSHALMSTEALRSEEEKLKRENEKWREQLGSVMSSKHKI